LACDISAAGMKIKKALAAVSMSFLTTKTLNPAQNGFPVLALILKLELNYKLRL
jgi:hypothetical protein